MSENLPDIKTFGQWVSVCEFESLFWKSSDDLVFSGGVFNSQHPPRPWNKLTNEFLPLLILAKHETGRRDLWDTQILLRANPTNEHTDGFEFDAEYCLRSFQPSYSSPDRSGYIEIVRGIGQEFSLQNKTSDKEQSLGNYRPQEGRDSDFGVDRMKVEILSAVQSKSRKENYHPSTILLVWLRHEWNLRYSKTAILEIKNELVEICAGKFAGMCVVGIAPGVNWIVGAGL